MRIRRIEIDGAAGHATIEREPKSTTIRVDQIIRNPKLTERSWETWHLQATASDEDLFKVATEVFQRNEGHAGTNSDIHEYFSELQRFQD